MIMQMLETGKRKRIRGNLSYVEDIYEFSIISWTHIIRNNGQRHIVYNITIDGCQFLENTLGKSNPIFGGVMKNVKNFMPELPPKCPIKKNKLLTVNNFYYNEEMFPPYLPDANFSAVIGLISQKTYAFK
uniref:Uncharacterized protein n=1 Tax=Stomoxys calcitrans TaxID=35570 RepID=A0A1I8Q4T8_STOCA